MFVNASARERLVRRSAVRLLWGVRLPDLVTALLKLPHGSNDKAYLSMTMRLSAFPTEMHEGFPC